MRLYLSSYRIPTPHELANLVGKPLHAISVALIPNAKDYYSQRAWNFKINGIVNDFKKLGLTVDVVDLRKFDGSLLKEKLKSYDLIWATGGNTYVLRHAMHRSGFDKVIRGLLNEGSITYGGESAGAIVAGPSIAGVESADEPEFAESIIKEGLGIVPFVILPHIDNVVFSEALTAFKKAQEGQKIIELKDSQAVVCNDDTHVITTGNFEK